MSQETRKSTMGSLNVMFNIQSTLQKHNLMWKAVLVICSTLTNGKNAVFN